MFEVTDTNLAIALSLHCSSLPICHNTHNTHYRTHKSAAPCIIGNFSTTAVQRVSSAECSRHWTRERAEVSAPFITARQHPSPFTCPCELATKHTRLVTNSIHDSETLKLVILLVSLATHILIQNKTALLPHSLQSIFNA